MLLGVTGTEPRDDDIVESGGSAIDRVRGFSDGVFAVAITLLVLNIEVPRGSGEPVGDVLADLGPYVFSYFIAFFVIGMFWYGHHIAWDGFTRSTPGLVWSNTLLLSLIVLIPFTTSLIDEYSDPEAFALYAANIGLAAIVDTFIDWLAYRQGVVGPAARQYGRPAFYAGSARAFVFILSIPLAWVDMTLAQVSWLLLLVLPKLAAGWSSPREGRGGSGEGSAHS